MDHHPFPWAMLRVWLLLLSVVAVFGIRALAAWWRRRSGRTAPPSAATARKRDAVTTRPR